jgi:hypothetical protein
MADVFISFIHEELRVAAAIQKLLEVAFSDRKIFLSSDEWQVHAGEIWLERIRQELTTAKVVVLMLSPKSVLRPWVNFEAGAAWLRDKAIIPACFGGLSKGSLPKPYSGIQALDLPADSYYLTTSVAHHVGTIAPPPPPPWQPDKEVSELETPIKETMT